MVWLASASRATTGGRNPSRWHLRRSLAAWSPRSSKSYHYPLPPTYTSIVSCARCVPPPGARPSFIRKRSAAAETARAFVAPRHHHGRRSSSDPFAQGPHCCPESQRDNWKTPARLWPARSCKEAPSTPTAREPSAPPICRRSQPVRDPTHRELCADECQTHWQPAC